MAIERVSRAKSFEGWVETYRHLSSVTGTPMRFSVFVPPQAERERVPILYWLSGLTCTDENFTAKAGAQRWCAEHGLFLVAPDTSPRGAGIPGEDAEYDVGTGAGFYVNATEEPWARNYRMYDYVTRELPDLVKAHFPVLPDRESVFGHSMGGHGALVIALRERGRYRSVSAFAPIAAPTRCPWGEKAFSTYLGPDRKKWEAYDANCLIQSGAAERIPLLVDQGTEDKFLADQLLPEVLEETCRRVGHPLELRRRAGYDHSYFFIASFVEEHIAYHASRLRSTGAPRA